MRTQCLLECYYGERLAKTTTQYLDHSIKSDEFPERNSQVSPQHLERSFQSDELTKKWYCQGWVGDNLLQMIENHERNDPLNAGQMQAMRALGANLRRIADCMQFGPAHLSVASNQAILFEEGLSDEEIQVVKRIYAERTFTNISKIARHLQACLTSRTFRMALGFLSRSTSSVPEELAAACELVRLIYPRVQEAIQAGPIYDELQQFIENRLDEVLH